MKKKCTTSATQKCVTAKIVRSNWLLLLVCRNLGGRALVAIVLKDRCYVNNIIIYLRIFSSKRVKGGFFQALPYFVTFVGLVHSRCTLKTLFTRTYPPLITTKMMLQPRTCTVRQTLKRDTGRKTWEKFTISFGSRNYFAVRILF